MKKILLFAMLFVGFVSAQAQNSGFMFDTLESVSGIDTVYLYPGGDAGVGDDSTTTVTESKLFQPGGILTVFCETDSLSGATGATMVLQFGHTSDPTIWYDKTTTTLNGAAVQEVLTSDTSFGFNRWRIRVIGASSTQKTRIRCSWAYSPKPN